MSNTIKPLYFTGQDFKTELRDEQRLWDVYITQRPEGILISNCWSAVRRRYDTGSRSVLIRVYEGLNKEIAYGINSRVFENTLKLYAQLKIVPENSPVLWSNEEEKQHFDNMIRDNYGIIKENATRLIASFDLELLVSQAEGKQIIRGKEEKQGPNVSIQHWEIKQ